MQRSLALVPQPSVLAVTFDASSQGQLAMVVYEWADMRYLGKVTSMVDDYLPVRTSPRSDRVSDCNMNELSRRHTSARPTRCAGASARRHNSADLFWTFRKV